MGALGDRMKAYERIPQVELTRRMPTIIRLDGKAFHSFTRGLEKPWDARMEYAMQETMQAVCAGIDGAAFGFWQSDEISVLLVDYRRLTSQAWFDKNVQKITSVSASLATYWFNYYATDRLPQKRDSIALFDSRVFVLPREEVNNYFLWRQQDATRNSILGLAQRHFSHLALHNKNGDQMQEMLWQKAGINWSTDTATYRKRGACAVRIEGGWAVDREPPVFSQDRSYIERWVYPVDEEGAERAVEVTA